MGGSEGSLRHLHCIKDMRISIAEQTNKCLSRVSCFKFENSMITFIEFTQVQTVVQAELHFSCLMGCISEVWFRKEAQRNETGLKAIPSDQNHNYVVHRLLIKE